MHNLPSSIFYILTGWTCVFNLYKFFYRKKIVEYKKDSNKINEIQLDSMIAHYKKADKLGKIFLTLWCFSSIWFFYDLNVEL